jgi:diguanylate cyclase
MRTRPITPHLSDKNQDSKDTVVSALQRALDHSKAQTLAEKTKVRALTIINESLCEELLEQEQKYLQIQNMAYYDTLTGLPNRNLLQDRFRLALANAMRQRKQIAVLFIDVNNFKTYNDNYGHAYGDLLLQEVANRLLSVLRAGDTICRYGGDEFVLLLPEVEGQQGAADVVAKLHAALSHPCLLKTPPTLPLRISIGMAVYPDDGETLTDLIRKADLAMYFKKGHDPHHSVVPIRRIIPGTAERAATIVTPTFTTHNPTSTEPKT